MLLQMLRIDDLTISDVSAGLVVGAIPSLIAPEASRVNVPVVWLVLSAPDMIQHSCVVTLILYVVFDTQSTECRCGALAINCLKW
jgi:hypothetical protein